MISCQAPQGSMVQLKIQSCSWKILPGSPAALCTGTKKDCGRGRHARKKAALKSNLSAGPKQKLSGLRLVPGLKSVTTVNRLTCSAGALQCAATLTLTLCSGVNFGNCSLTQPLATWHEYTSLSKLGCTTHRGLF